MFVRIFIPKKHRQRFDEMVSQSLISRLRGRSFSEHRNNRLRRSRSEDHPDRLLSVSTRASSVPRTSNEDVAMPPARGLRKTTSLIAGHSSSFSTRRSVKVSLWKDFLKLPFAFVFWNISYSSKSVRFPLTNILFYLYLCFLFMLSFDFLWFYFITFVLFWFAFFYVTCCFMLHYLVHINIDIDG